MNELYALFMLVVVHTTGEPVIVPVERFFATEADCEANAYEWNENWLLFDVPRDFDAFYFCTTVEEGEA